MDYAIIGAGFLGSKIYSFLKEKELKVKATSLKNDFFTQLDITDKKMVDRFFAKHKPKNTVLCASLSNVDECEAFTEKAGQINVGGTKNISDACTKNDSKIVFISSDYVFDGKKGNYREEDKTNPLQVYGETKVKAENIVLENPKNIILRVSSLYGKSTIQKPTFETHVLEKINRGEKVLVAADQITCPTLIDDVANAVFLLVEKNVAGVFHGSGSEAISRHGFALKLVKNANSNPQLIHKTSLGKLGLVAKRPKNSSLNIGKLNKIGIRMSNVEQGLKNAFF